MHSQLCATCYPAYDSLPSAQDNDIERRTCGTIVGDTPWDAQLMSNWYAAKLIIEGNQLLIFEQQRKARST